MATAMPDAKNLANQVTLHVTIKRARQWTIRLRIAALLIRLAAWIAWLNVEFHEQEPQ